MERSSGMTSDQVLYAYRVCGKLASKYLDTPALGYEDLVQIGMEAIVRELGEHPELNSYTAWMGKVAHWEMVNTLRHLLGRRGFHQNGKPRVTRPITIYAYEAGREFSYEPELADALITQEMLDLLTEKQLEVVELLLKGYSQREISRRLGVSEMAISLRRQAAKHKLEVNQG